MNKLSANSQDFLSQDIARRSIERNTPRSAISYENSQKKIRRTDIFFGPEPLESQRVHKTCSAPLSHSAILPNRKSGHRQAWTPEREQMK